MQSSKNPNNVPLEEYSELIKTVARMEYSRLSTSAHLLEFSELINIGATTVYVVLSSQPKAQHNNSYIATAIKWSIRNELRRRYKWYALKSSSSKENEDNLSDATKKEELRSTLYETILSIDDMEQSECPVQIEDESLNPEQKTELMELKKAICEAIEKLPKKERIVLELKFYKNKKIKDIATELDLSSSRITKLIQSALDRIKARLLKEGII